MKVEPTEFVNGLNVKEKTKDNAKVLGLSYWVNYNVTY